MKIYLLLDEKNFVKDCITYEFPGYTLHETEEIPPSIMGGHFRLEEGTLVEYPDLKPVNEPSEIEKIKVLLSSSTEKYDTLDKVSTGLESLKVARISKLKEESTSSIYDGFVSESTGYSFGFNELDQVNFTQRMLTIVAGATGPFKWKTKDAGVVELTKEEFIVVIQEAEAHKLDNQEHYWQLEELILSAETNAQVDSIAWA